GLQRRVAHGDEDVSAQDTDVIGRALRLDLGDAYAGARIGVLLAPAGIQGDDFDAEPGAGAPVRIGVRSRCPGGGRNERDRRPCCDATDEMGHFDGPPSTAYQAAVTGSSTPAGRPGGVRM